MTNYSYSAAQVFSSQRWALTGDAGVFLDPLYSPGLDLIAISNSLVCDLVEMDREGKDLEEYAAIHNRIFMLIVEGWSKIYSGQYVVMGSARAMTAKIVWDTAAYWAVPGLLYFQDHLRLICGFPQILTAMARLSSINEHAQRLFREWAALELDQRTQRPVFASLYDYDFMPGLHAGMTRQLAGEELAAKISENVDLLENLVGQLADVLISECQTLGGAAADQAQAWAAEPQIAALRERYLDLPANHVPADNWLHFAEPALSDAECSPVEGKAL
jgi:alkylhalidase